MAQMYGTEPYAPMSADESRALTEARRIAEDELLSEAKNWCDLPTDSRDLLAGDLIERLSNALRFYHG